MTRGAIAMAVTLTAAGAASAAVQTKTVDYEADGVQLKGFLAYDDAAKDKRPGVLVFPEWWGLNDYAKTRARQLAEMGYVAFAADLYGDGKVIDVAHPQDAQKMATALRMNVKAWRGRAEAALKVLTGQPNVDASKVAAIGYCLGGSTALQLAYAGADLKAVSTFHAALPAPTAEEAKAIKGRVLVNHGADDKFIPGQGDRRLQGGPRRRRGEAPVRQLPRGGSQLHRAGRRQGEQPGHEVRQGGRREVVAGDERPVQGHARAVRKNGPQMTPICERR